MRALELLARRRLVDPSWVRDWCTFRTQQAVRRVETLRSVRELLDRAGNA